MGNLVMSALEKPNFACALSLFSFSYLYRAVLMNEKNCPLSSLSHKLCYNLLTDLKLPVFIKSIILYVNDVFNNFEQNITFSK